MNGKFKSFILCNLIKVIKVTLDTCITSSLDSVHFLKNMIIMIILKLPRAIYISDQLC